MKSCQPTDGSSKPSNGSTEAPNSGIFTAPGAISSAGERCLHTAEDAGSIPASPTPRDVVNVVRVPLREHLPDSVLMAGNYGYQLRGQDASQVGTTS